MPPGLGRFTAEILLVVRAERAIARRIWALAHEVATDHPEPGDR